MSPNEGEIEDGLKGKKMALFFTLGVSLRLWDRQGILSREVRLYNELAKALDRVFFLTYGSRDGAYASEIAPIEVLPRPRAVPKVFYSFLMPFIHHGVLKEVYFLKTNQMPGAWAAAVAKFLFRKRLIVRCGFEWKKFLEERRAPRLKRLLAHLLELLIYRAADVVVLTSEEMKQYVCRVFGLLERKVVVIPNYVDTDLFRPIPGARKVPNRLIFTGRFVKQKNLQNLLKALRDLPEVELVLVGDGPLREALSSFVKSHRLKVRFMGWVPNEQLPEILNTAEAFVLPSLYEGNPKALLEAMACGLAVIATNVDGIKDLVSHGVNGYLCRDTSPEALREAIREVLSNEELRARLGLNARMFVLRNFSLTAVVAREISLLKMLAKPK